MSFKQSKPGLGEGFLKAAACLTCFSFAILLLGEMAGVASDNGPEAEKQKRAWSGTEEQQADDDDEDAGDVAARLMDLDLERPLHLELHLVMLGESFSEAGKLEPCCAPEQQLEGAIWSELPEEILDRTLPLLPLATRARFRAVCKHWRWMLSSPEFLSRCQDPAAPVRAEVCSLWYHRRGRGFVQDPDEVARPRHIFRTLNVELDFLPTKFRTVEDGHVRVASSRCGLICIQTRTWDPHALWYCVVNPVNRTFRELPALDMSHYSFYEVEANLVVDTSGPGEASFKVCVIWHAGGELRRGQVYVYSSSDRDWNAVHDQGVVGVTFSPNGYDRFFFTNCCLYAITDGTASGPRKVVTFTHTAFCIRSVYVPDFQPGFWGEEGHVLVGEHRGKLLCWHGAMWVLEASLTWVQVAGMPPEDLLPLAQSGLDRCRRNNCVQKLQVVGDIVFLTVRLGSSLENYVYAYHMVKHSWQRVLHLAEAYQFLDLKPDLFISP